MNSNQLRVILFDLGGVLVELTGVPRLLSWLGNRITPEELWEMWLSSPVVRSFETGRSGPEEFADHLIREMGLPVNRDEFIREFTLWPKRSFDGAHNLLHRLSPTYVRATLSNTNVLHWPRYMGEMGFSHAFDHHFASHLIGRIKPDEDAFHYVVDKLGHSASAILFLDDNELNVIGARRVGMRAVCVKGVREAEQALLRHGVIDAAET